jgi:amidohydrolase family protein
MNELKLHHVFTYDDRDREFWASHLEDWVPRRLIDAHVHFVDSVYQIETMSEEMRRAHWSFEVSDMQSAETLERCMGIVFPGREVSCVGFAYPSLGWDVEGANAYVSAEAARRGWRALALVRPTWVAEQVDWLLDQPQVIGVKPYYMMRGYDKTGRDRFIESSIFDFLPHHQLEVIDGRGAWVTLHVPREGRLGHPENLREVREIRRRYPNIKLVIAHLGRSYTLPHAEEGIVPLADDPGLFFDNSAVLNPEVHLLALQRLGPRRILYGTDNPIFYMRGRREWRDRTYINHTSHPFHWNRQREAPEIEARYTLYMYEALKALRGAFERLGLGAEDAEDVFHRNAERLIAGIR